MEGWRGVNDRVLTVSVHAHDGGKSRQAIVAQSVLEQCQSRFAEKLVMEKGCSGEQIKLFTHLIQVTTTSRMLFIVQIASTLQT